MGTLLLLLAMSGPNAVAAEPVVIPLWPEGVPAARSDGGTERIEDGRTYMVHTVEDVSVLLENSLLYFQALRRAGVAAELHLYERGPHGFGTSPGLGPTSEWPRRLEEWMRSHGWLAPGGAPSAVP